MPAAATLASGTMLGCAPPRPWPLAHAVTEPGSPRIRPVAPGRRGAAKTHRTTDEAALKQLAALHPLPALVMEHR